MHKAVITTDKNQTIYLEYNNNKYDFEYVENKNIIILRRLKDKQILEIFDDKIGFIVQVNSGIVTSFVVSSYQDENTYLKHYAESFYGNKLDLKKKFTCSSPLIDECRITNNSFIVEQHGDGGLVYCLNENSKWYDHIYIDERINIILGDKVLMVSEEKQAKNNPYICDTITYGINPETFEIVTPIWSELQQRWIKVYTNYTEKDVAMIKEKKAKDTEYTKGDYPYLDDVTIYFEIQKYLNILDNYLDRPQQIYLDDFGTKKFNKEFVKKFDRNI